MNIIACIDSNYGIGYQGNLLYHIPEDMKFFRDKTKHKIVVMGRETYQSLKSPLKDRTNIVLSSNKEFKDKRVIICRTIKSLFKELEKYNTDEIFIIGGGVVYLIFLRYCSYAYITQVIGNKKERIKKYSIFL